MDLLILLLLKIFPLYIIVLLGYLSAKYFLVNRDSIAVLLMYFLVPFVIFSSTIHVKINAAVVFLPVFVFMLSSVLSFLTLSIFKNSWKDSSANILAFSAGTGNTGYFGIPLAMIFFDTELANIYIFTVLASVLYEATTGFYITAKGNFSAKESFIKVIRLPSIYAFSLGIIFNLLDIGMANELKVFSENFKGAYTVLGMMMLGMGLKGIARNSGHFDFKFISILLIIKFIIWPALVLFFIQIDKLYFNILNEDLYKVLFLISIVPLAANTVTLAVLLKAEPEKASLSVFLSTIISIISIPIYIYFYGNF